MKKQFYKVNKDWFIEKYGQEIYDNRNISYSDRKGEPYTNDFIGDTNDGLLVVFTY